MYSRIEPIDITPLMRQFFDACAFAAVALRKYVGDDSSPMISEEKLALSHCIAAMQAFRAEYADLLKPETNNALSMK